MSQDGKGRTMIGTVAPIIPRSTPPGSAPPPAAIPTSSAQQPTMVVANPASSAATVGMRPRPDVMASDPDLIVGQELCGYTIKRKLAEGGMGVVYEGEHGRIGRRGAIKVLKQEFCRSEEVIERFTQEARAVNKIRHENIVDIYDFGRDPHGRVFFVMEYLDGEPLSARIRRGALPWMEAFPILEQTLRALKAAHDHGFVHRDLKPDNIWLGYIDGRVRVKLLDFGIAKLVGTESPKEKLTQTGSVIGTPHYMSPEQINGSRDVDQRTDIYAMGVITYELFAGVTPFVGDTLQAIMTGHLFKDPPRLAEIPMNLGVPPPIAEIVDRMLFKDPAGRYQSVTDVLDDLHDVNQQRWPAKAETLSRLRPKQQPALAPVVSTAPRPSRKRAVAIGGVLVAGLAIAGAVWQSQQETADTVVVSPPPSPAPTPASAPPIVEETLDYEALRKSAHTTLRSSLREPEPAVRAQGSDALGKVKHQPAVPALIELAQQDPDELVRGHAGEALGTMGVTAEVALLAKLEAGAPPPLKVWYASALARLGDPRAKERLLDYARSKDLAVSFKAALTLADVSQPGDRKAIRALHALTAHEARLNEFAPYAGAMLLSKMAALRDADARKRLHALLERDHEGARLAAAEGLAKLGDDAGKQVLQGVLANQDSPNRLTAAVALISLGEYAGFELITAKLDDKDRETRRLAARALGEIGERKSLQALIALAGDKDWTLRVAASAAIVAIVGIDPQVLAQASIDWTKSALDSQDWAVRKAAAGVLADIPEKEAVPLLAQAIKDADPKVRLAAAKSAGKMKSAEAALQVADAAKTEADPGVKEQQVKALGEIGNPVAKDTLAQISDEPGRLGVIAAGSLIAVGDTSGKGKEKLEAAVIAPQPELRLAAVQAASSARNPIVVPTLKLGILDRIFDIRFTAAEGLAAFIAEKAAAMPVLTAALESKQVDIVSRAMAALLKLGEKIADKARQPAELLDSADPKRRLAAVPIVRAMVPSEGVPLLRRLVADPDQDVRRAGVDAIEDVVARDKEAAIKLYRPLVSDADPVVRSKASGQLARLVPPPAPMPSKGASAAPAAKPPDPAAPAPGPDPAQQKIEEAAAAATAAAAAAKRTTDGFAALTAELATTTAAAPRDEATTGEVEDLAIKIAATAAKLEEEATAVETAAKAAADTAGASPSPDAAKLVDEAKTLASTARAAATAARGKVADAEKQARKYVTTWTGDPQKFITAADAAIATGDFADAKQNLEKAAKLLRKSRVRNAGIDYSYAQLYDKMAARTADPAAKRKLLQQAEAAYRQFAKSGTGPRVKRANDRAAELAELNASGQP